MCEVEVRDATTKKSKTNRKASSHAFNRIRTLYIHHHSPAHPFIRLYPFFVPSFIITRQINSNLCDRDERKTSRVQMENNRWIGGLLPCRQRYRLSNDDVFVIPLKKGFIWVLWTINCPYVFQLNFTRFGNCILSSCRLPFVRQPLLSCADTFRLCLLCGPAQTHRCCAD